MNDEGLPHVGSQPPPVPSGDRGGMAWTGGEQDEAEAPEEPVEPAQFPSGFWAGVDYMLHHPDQIRQSLGTDADVWKLARILFSVSFAMSAIYGAVMGATNLLQGSGMPLWGKFMMIAITAIKVPALFLITLAIVFPPVYVSNAFAGARLTFRRVLATLLASLAITSTMLASMASVAFFFALTSRSYDFIKLLNVLFFAYAGLCGLTYLNRNIKLTVRQGGAGVSTRIAVLWLFLYMFVGTQLAWVLRPFVGNPGEQVEIFRERSGNFYESVFDSLKKVMGDEPKAQRL